MEQSEGNWMAMNLRRIANEAAELPGARWLAKPLYRRVFRQPYRTINAYHGIYASYAEAQAAAQQVKTLPTTYDISAAGHLYRDQIEQLRVSDYPLLFWLSRLLVDGQRKLFDLGGHIGVSYYGFRRYLDYPADLRWLVHDVPAVLATGREWALKHDPDRLLAFTDERSDADGQDVLMSSGALQYLDYSLPDLLRTLQSPPPHVLVNLTPMHPGRSFFTLQNLGIAICPYRVTAVPEFIAAMESLGYTKQDQWHSTERHLRIPFEPAHSIDGYHGFYFHRG